MKKIKAKLRKNDQVVVISGKEKGKQGKVLKVLHAKNRVVVAGINMVKKAMKKRKQEDKDGIIEIECPIHISNLMYAHRGARSRIAIKRDKDGKPKRVAIKDKAQL